MATASVTYLFISICPLYLYIKYSLPTLLSILKGNLLLSFILVNWASDMKLEDFTLLYCNREYYDGTIPERRLFTQADCCIMAIKIPCCRRQTGYVVRSICVFRL